MSAAHSSESDLIDLISLYAAETPDECHANLANLLKTICGTSSFAIAHPQLNGQDYRITYSKLAKLEQGSTVPLDHLSPGLFSGNEAIGDLPDNVVSLKRADDITALALSDDPVQYGYLIIEGTHPPDNSSLCLLQQHLGVILCRLETSTLYSQQHHLDALKLAGITRVGEILCELSLERVLPAFLELTITTLSADVGCLVFIDRQSTSDACFIEYGVSKDEMESLQTTENELIIDVVTKHQAIWLTDTREELDSLPSTPFLDKLSGFIFVPLSTKNGDGCVFVSNPGHTDPSDIALVETISKLGAIAIDNAVLHRRSIEEAKFKQQLETAGNVQKSLLPENTPSLPNTDVYGLNIPCDDSGGDFYDYFLLPDGRLCFALADATGHGIAAALLATNARATLRAIIKSQSDNIKLSDLCFCLNNLLFDDFADDKFITMFIGIYDPVSMQLHYCNAGHDPLPIIFCPTSQSLTELPCSGLPLGMLADMKYDNIEAINLDQSALLLVLSDGVNEALNNSNEQFGKARIINYINAQNHLPVSDFVDGLADAVFDFTKNKKQNDDITVLCIKDLY